MKGKIDKRYYNSKDVGGHLLEFIWGRTNANNLWEALLTAFAKVRYFGCMHYLQLLAGQLFSVVASDFSSGITKKEP